MAILKYHLIYINKVDMEMNKNFLLNHQIEYCVK